MASYKSAALSLVPPPQPVAEGAHTMSPSAKLPSLTLPGVAEFKVSDFLNLLVAKIDATPGFETNLRAQAETLFMIAEKYKLLPQEYRDKLKSAIGSRVPKIHSSPNPGTAFEHTMKLYTLNPVHALEEISQSLKSVLPRPTYLPCPDEQLYQVGGWLEDYVNYAKEAECPVAFHFWAGVSIIGSCCRYKYWIDRGNDKLRLNNYIMLVGSKATGKSISKDLAGDIAARVNSMLNPDPLTLPEYRHKGTINIIPEDSTKEAIIRDLAFSTYTKPSEPEKVFYKESSGLLLVDELATLFGRQTHAVETKIPFFTSIYSTKDYKKSALVSASFDLKYCATNILACAAPDWLLESVTPIMFRGGFFDRWRFVFRPDGHSPRVYSKPATTDPIVANILAEYLVPLCQAEEYVEIMATKDAADEFDSWYKLYHDSNAKLVQTKRLSVQRMGNQIWKLACILAISDGSAPYVLGPHIAKSTAILEHEENFHDELMEFVDRDMGATLLDQLELKIMDSGGMMSRRDLRNWMRGRKGYLPLESHGDRMIQELISMERLVEHGGKAAKVGGRPSKLYFVISELALREWHTRRRVNLVETVRRNMASMKGLVDEL